MRVNGSANSPTRKIGVGIIGFRPSQSWGGVAHGPAIAALSEHYTLVGIANSAASSAQAAVSGMADVIAFASAEELVRCAAVDLVAITVKVPHHAQLVRLALSHGKHVLCEWPLALSLGEAEELARFANERAEVAAVGTQAVYAPAVRQLQLLRERGDLGTLLSASVVGYGMTWGATIDRRNAYLLDPANGATMLAIAVGHLLAAIEASFGPVDTVGAALALRRQQAIVVEGGDPIRHAGPDQILLTCTMADGLPFSIHYRGGIPRGSGLIWQVDGERGSARITSSSGLLQLAPLTLRTSFGNDNTWQIDTLPTERPVVDGVRSLYRDLADAIRGKPNGVPSFADAVRLHRIIAAIERSAVSGCRQRVEEQC